MRRRASSHLAVVEPSGPLLEGGLNHDTVALYYTDQNHHRIKFNDTEDCWLIWDGHIWRPQPSARLIREEIRQLCRELRKENPAKEASQLRFAESVAQFTSGDQRVRRLAHDFDNDVYLVGAPGGQVDLRTGQLEPGDPLALITKAVACDPAPSSYAPRWQRFLDEITGGDRDLIDFLNRYLGAALLGDNRHHKLVYLHGPGGNGKGVLVRVIQKLFGDYARTAPMDMFLESKTDRHSVDIAHLRGARLVLASEVSPGKRWDQGKLKSLTGGDRQNARLMHSNPIEFDPTFSFVFQGNSTPRLLNPGAAEERRFLIVPFRFTPAAPNPDLFDELWEERAAIMRWLVEGCTLFLDPEVGGLSVPEVVRRASEEYINENNIVGRWANDRLVVENGNHHLFTSIGDLYLDFEAYCSEEGEASVSKKALSLSLKDMGIGTPDRGLRGTKRGLRGVMLKSGDDR